LCYHQADFGGAFGRSVASKGECYGHYRILPQVQEKVDIKDPQHITMKNGKPATTGTCPTCGTKIYKIGKA